MKLITVDHLDDLARGATILGSGGGGSPLYFCLLAKHMIETHGPIPLLSLEELEDEAVVLPVAFMGAPSVSEEKIPNGREFEAIFSKINPKPTVLMPAEIGGANAFTPLWVAAKYRLPVLDGDTIGRAFPELQMSTCTIFDVKASPAFIADGFENIVEINSENPEMIELLARQIAIGMGSQAAVALYRMSGAQAKKTIVSGTITQAIELGKQKNGPILASGIITDIDQRIERGFLVGTACLHTTYGDYYLDYQNEFLRVRSKGKSIALTPDIITLIEQDSGIPITTSALQFGLRVNLLLYDAPSIWRTSEGMKLVGPQVFGYEIDHKENICV